MLFFHVREPPIAILEAGTEAALMSEDLQKLIRQVYRAPSAPASSRAAQALRRPGDPIGSGPRNLLDRTLSLD